MRGIILRQIREQPRRDDAKRLLDQEIGALRINSEVIRQQLAVLGAPVLELTPEERSFFKEPVVLLTEPSTQSLEVTVAVSKPTAEEVKAGKFLQEPAGPEALLDDVRDLVQRAKTMFEVKNYVDAEKFYYEARRENARQLLRALQSWCRPDRRRQAFGCRSGAQEGHRDRLYRILRLHQPGNCL